MQTNRSGLWLIKSKGMFRGLQAHEDSVERLASSGGQESRSHCLVGTVGLGHLAWLVEPGLCVISLILYPHSEWP